MGLILMTEYNEILQSILNQCKLEGVELEIGLLFECAELDPSSELRKKIDDNEAIVFRYLVNKYIEKKESKPDNVVYLSDRKK